MDRFRQIELFVAVVERGSFVAAGEALHLSKAAVSRSVIELEKRVGGRLLQRTTRRVSLTEAGSVYYERCKQVLAQLEDADSAVDSITRRTIGRLKINAPVSFGIQYLAGLWQQFLAQYPDVELDIHLDDRKVDIVEEGYDAVIRIGQLPDSTLVQRKLASTQLIACASPDYLRRNGELSHPEDLSKHSVIGYSYRTHRDVWPFSGLGGVHEVQTQPRFRANNGDTCLALALGGVGVALQPDFLIWRELRSGSLVQVLPDFDAPELGIYVVFPSRKQLSVKVRALVDFLLAEFAEAPWTR